MSKKTIGVFVGSLRKDSYNRIFANYAASVASEDFDMKFIDISKLELFNEDLEGTPPSSWVTFREEIKDLDGFLFFTPEYNRSLPAVLKNAIDVGSRPYGQNLWGGKPAGIMSVSIGGISGFGANHHLRQVLTFVDVYPLQQPEAYIGNAMGLVDENGVINDDTQAFVQTFMAAFEGWVKKFD